MQIQIYTVADVAEILQVHKKTVIDWLENNEIASITINDEWRILGEDLYDFLKKNRTEATSNQHTNNLFMIKNNEK